MENAIGYVRWAQLGGRLTNKHTTTTCLQRRFEFTSRENKVLTVRK